MVRFADSGTLGHGIFFVFMFKFCTMQDVIAIAVGKTTHTKNQEEEKTDIAKNEGYCWCKCDRTIKKNELTVITRPILLQDMIEELVIQREMDMIEELRNELLMWRELRTNNNNNRVHATLFQTSEATRGIT